MILDKLLFTEIKNIGNIIMQEANLKSKPSNAHHMHLFWSQFSKGLSENKMYYVLLGNILFHFITNTSVRNRQTNSRIFEDIFSALFGSISSDVKIRNNPSVCESVAFYDKNTPQNKFISDAMSGNKREKCDLFIGNYSISLKTLKGPIYDEYGNIIDSSKNTELNIGSFNYIALLYNIIPNEKLNMLSDRKSGLGSGKQLRENVFDVIKKNNMQTNFYNKLSDLFTYVYGDDDIYIILKSHYNIIFFFIPANSFVESILLKYKKEEESFEKIWYRWENNNLRFNWVNLINFMDKENITYYKNNISLAKAVHNKKYNKFLDLMKKSINSNLYVLVQED